MDRINRTESGIYYFYVGEALCVADEEDKELIDSLPLSMCKFGLRVNRKPSILLKRLIVHAKSQKVSVLHKNGVITDVRKSNLVTEPRRARCPGRGHEVVRGGKALGVNLIKEENRRYWRAQVFGSKNRKIKRFNVDKYGYDEALRLAIKWRCDMVQRTTGWKESQADYDGWGNRTKGEFYG